jgi:hypothetical protein
MSFTPTAAQLELHAELQTARMPRALIADRLGIDHATFKAWTARLDAGRDYVEPPENAAIFCASFAQVARNGSKSRMSSPIACLKAIDCGAGVRLKPPKTNGKPK